MTEEERRRRKRAIAVRERKKRIRRRKILFLFILILILIAILLGLYVLSNSKKVKESLTLEAGSTIKLADFLIDSDAEAVFVTDISVIDTSKPRTYDVTISVNNKQYLSTLVIVDTIAPKAEAFDATIFSGETLNPMDCVTNVSDATEVTANFETQPDLSEGGEIPVVVVLTDAGGNQTRVTSVVTVIMDTQAPVIEGVKDISAFIGDSISYKANITVTDDMDENPTLEIDNSKVDLNTAGTYDVIYTATDAAGNTSSCSIMLTLSEKPEGYVEPEEVYALAQEIYDEITDDSMSDMQRAFAIYRWVRTNIGYTGDSDKSSWTIGAYEAFKNRCGDCFNYFAAAKALFDVAGIDNIDIVKSDTSHSSHFWSIINLGDGWYHVDCTPRKGDGDNFFMVTDEELESYSLEHHNSHIFESNLYPERATVSVQDKVDYDNAKIIE